MITKTSGHTRAIVSGGRRPSPKAPPIAANATTRPFQPGDACQANRAAMKASATGMIVSSTHSGMPTGSILPPSRSAITTWVAAYASTPTVAAATE